MEIVKPSAKILHMPDILQQMEYAGRVCTNTTEKASSETAVQFLRKRAEQQEWSVFEHAGVVADNRVTLDLLPEETPEFGLVMSRAVLGGVRCADAVKYCSKYRENIEGLLELTRDESLISVEVICSRAASQQLERHRNMSFCEQSLRYVKPASLTLVSWNPDRDKQIEAFTAATEAAMTCYISAVNSGCSLDDARKLLPLGIATRLVVTGQLSWWYDVFSKRYCTKASKETILLMQQIYTLMPDNLKQRSVSTGLAQQFAKADKFLEASYAKQV